MTRATPLAIAAAMAILTMAACERRDSRGTNGAGPTPADNTARNKADRDGATKTPTDQSQSAADIRISADIRRAIMDDKSLSVNAQNCKIVTEGGVVTLRGVAQSQAEKDAIGAKAGAVAGVTRVDNQIEVKSN
jgi:hyperosmotically inducible periplasmic protein